MSTEPSDLEKKIIEKATQAEEYELDGERVKNRPLPDMIAADEYLGRKRASRNPFAAMKIARISTQGPER
ncbi:MAG: hypothetical protein PHC30_05215 [Lentisphaeria bacterium]|nr:hypothetical protein [Lentisphaeria bacterium]